MPRAFYLNETQTDWAAGRDDRDGYRQRAKLVVEHGYAGQPGAAVQPARG